MGKNKTLASASILLSILAGAALGWAWFPFRGATEETGSPISGPSHPGQSAQTPPESKTAPTIEDQTPDALGFIEIVQKAKLDELPGLYESWLHRTADPEAYRKRRLVLMRWMELDPRHAIAWFKEQGHGNQIRYLFEIWAQIDVDAAVKASQSLAEGDNAAASYQSGILASLAQTDRTAFLYWLDRLQPAFVSSVYMRPILTDLMEGGAEGRQQAIKLLAMLKESPEKGKAAGLIARLWISESDSPQEAIEWALTFEDRQVLSGALVELAKSDPDAAGPYMKHITKFVVNKPAHSIVRIIAEEDPFRAIRWLDAYANPSDMRKELIADITRHLPTSEIERFVALAASFGHRQLDGVLAIAIAKGRSTDEIKELLALAEPRKDDAVWKRVRSKLLDRWADMDPKAAIGYLEALPGHIRDHIPVIMNDVIPESFEMDDDFPRALRIAEFIPESMQNSYMGRVLNELAETDPLQAIAIAQQSEDPAEKGHLHGEAAEGWATVAPIEAAAWAATLPEGEARNEAFKNIADRWASRESYAASEWVASLESGLHRDWAINGLVDEIESDDVDAAFQWLLAIEHERPRFHTASGVAYQMARQDPIAGLEKIQSSSLPDKTKQRMIERIQRHLEDLQQ